MIFVKMILMKILIVFLFFGNAMFTIHAQEVRIVGAMKNVMKKGELFGTINLDSLSNKTHLYGMGPVEYLTGEITVVDGRAFKSTIQSNGEMKVEETF